MGGERRSLERFFFFETFFPFYVRMGKQSLMLQKIRLVLNSSSIERCVFFSLFF